MVYKTKGVCAQEIQFEMDADHKIHNVQFSADAAVIPRECQHL